MQFHLPFSCRSPLWLYAAEGLRFCRNITIVVLYIIYHQIGEVANHFSKKIATGSSLRATAPYETCTSHCCFPREVSSILTSRKRCKTSALVLVCCDGVSVMNDPPPARAKGMRS